MSLEKQVHEARRWLRTAREDLEAAEALCRSELFSHACFLSQQAGEKAMKALWYSFGEDPWGHSIQRLVLEFPELSIRKQVADLVEESVLLDRYYIPTRYPNGLPDLTPGQVYLSSDAEIALAAARQILSRVSSLIGVPQEA